MWYREASSGRPKRTYVIEGDEDQLDKLEQVFSAITGMCSMGASRDVTIFVDGDGAANIRVERKEGELKSGDWDSEKGFHVSLE